MRYAILTSVGSRLSGEDDAWGLSGNSTKREVVDALMAEAGELGAIVSVVEFVKEWQDEIGWCWEISYKEYVSVEISSDMSAGDAAQAFRLQDYTTLTNSGYYSARKSSQSKGRVIGQAWLEYEMDEELGYEIPFSYFQEF